MQKNTSFVLREIYGKYLLMPTRKNEVGENPILLNNVAAAIWKNVEGFDSREELLDHITDFYCLQKNSAEAKTVENFIEQLIESKLIQERRVY